MRAVCGRFVGGLQTVCGRFAASFICDGIRLSVCVWQFAFGGLHLAVCVWRFAFGVWRFACGSWAVCGGFHLRRVSFVGLRLALDAWRFAFGGLRLAVRVWRFAFGGLRADCWRFCGRFCGRFTVGSLRAVCEWQAGGCRAICGWRFAATINKIYTTRYLCITPLQTRSNCASRNAGHLVIFLNLKTFLGFEILCFKPLFNPLKNNNLG